MIFALLLALNAQAVLAVDQPDVPRMVEAMIQYLSGDHAEKQDLPWADRSMFVTAGSAAAFRSVVGDGEVRLSRGSEAYTVRPAQALMECPGQAEAPCTLRTQGVVVSVDDITLNELSDRGGFIATVTVRWTGGAPARPGEVSADEVEGGPGAEAVREETLALTLVESQNAWYVDGSMVFVP